MDESRQCAGCYKWIGPYDNLFTVGRHAWNNQLQRRTAVDSLCLCTECLGPVLGELLLSKRHRAK